MRNEKGCRLAFGTETGDIATGMKNMMFLSLPLIALSFLLLGCLRHAHAEPRTLSVEVTVPDPAWKVTIEEVYLSDDRILVVSRLARDPEVMAPQVISKATDSVRISAPNLPVEHYIIGRTFRWAQEPHHFIDDQARMKEIVEGKFAERIYRRPETNG